MQELLSLETTKNKRSKIKNKKIEVPEIIIESIGKIILEVIGDDYKLDNIEVGLTKILSKIREKTTKKILESQNPEKNKCKCGEMMKSKGFKTRKIIGLSEYEIKRRLFYCKKCKKYEMPLDSIINIPHRYSLEMKKAIILLGQETNFENASHILNQLLQVQISHETIQEYVEKIGKAIEKKEDNDIKKSFDEDGYLKDYQECLTKNKIKDTAYLLIDGSMVFTREEKWKEIRLGVLYPSKNVINPDKNHKKILKKKYFGSYNKKEGTIKDFLKKTEFEAYEFRFQDYEQQVILGDGAHYIWEYATTAHPNAIQILDYFHASEYLGSALKSLTAFSCNEKGEIKQEQFDNLWNGNIQENLFFLNNQNKTKEIIDCIRYFENNKQRMKYGEYRNLGLNIGSGAIESAHRIVIQSRMKQSGMRWSQKNVQSIVSLRSKYLSGEWNDIIDNYLLAA